LGRDITPKLIAVLETGPRLFFGSDLLTAEDAEDAEERTVQKSSFVSDNQSWMNLKQFFNAGSSEATDIEKARGYGRLLLFVLVIALLPPGGHLDFGGFFALLGILVCVPLWLKAIAAALKQKERLHKELILQPFLFTIILLIAWKIQS
jgi:hypothetical protein